MSSGGKGTFIGDGARWLVISQMDWAMLGELLEGTLKACVHGSTFDPGATNRNSSSLYFLYNCLLLRLLVL